MTTMQAYKKLALKWHPNKNETTLTTLASTMFLTLACEFRRVE